MVSRSPRLVIAVRTSQVCRKLHHGFRHASAEETLTLTPDRARQRAEKSFKKEERGRDARNAMAEYEAQAAAIRKKTAHLKALRLAKEAEGLASDPDC
jgi:hypothetical protein